jgi:putative glutamine amidotransferase
MHHQGIDRLAEMLRAVAVTDDGLVEAVEIPELPFVMGVQWHPEELARTDQHSSSLFYDFVSAAANGWREEVPPNWKARVLEMWQSTRASSAVGGGNDLLEAQMVACS